MGRTTAPVPERGKSTKEASHLPKVDVTSSRFLHLASFDKKQRRLGQVTLNLPWTYGLVLSGNVRKGTKIDENVLKDAKSDEKALK